MQAQNAEFTFYLSNPNKPTSLKVTPKGKDFFLASSKDGSFVILFENSTQYELEIAFPEPLHAVPNPLYVPPGQVGSVTIAPTSRGDFVCYASCLGCPTCSTKLLRTSTVSTRSEGDGEGDADPIIKIKP